MKVWTNKLLKEMIIPYLAKFKIELEKAWADIVALQNRSPMAFSILDIEKLEKEESLIDLISRPLKSKGKIPWEEKDNWEKAINRANMNEKIH